MIKLQLFKFWISPLGQRRFQTNRRFQMRDLACVIQVLVFLFVFPVFAESKFDCKASSFQETQYVQNLVERKQLGEESLGRVLSEKEVEALEKAHRVGWEAEGEDKTPARIENYTDAQKREKYRILRQAGFSKEEARKLMEDGVAGWWNFWRKPPLPPPTDILTELNQKSTEVESLINAYNHQMQDFVYNTEIDDLYEHIYNIPEIKHIGKIGTTYYWGRYVPRKIKKGEDPSLRYTRGQFIIGFGMAVQGRPGSDRAGHWVHRIHWESGARNMPELDGETVKQIFTEVYGGDPKKIITEFQSQYITETPYDGITESVKKFIIPFIFNDTKKEEVKQAILKVLQERVPQIISEKTEK